ncbi:serine hydrolase [Streptococcus sp. IMAU 99161]|uniref:serine hydrolase n=1 Tax=Streptococcus sp. IMAU 99161 TaxID=2710601 RepID=UPI0016553FB0|nr:serine hydrolase [Streptococcus sp. IMAU 99161]MBC8775255.1 serine hydrolase [Streptococcus sp. IMAU 99161]
MNKEGVQVPKRFLLLLFVPMLFIGSQAASVERSGAPQTVAPPSELYFSSIPANPNVYHKVAVFADPQLKKASGDLLPNTPFTIEQLFVNDQGQAVFKIADKGYVLADSSAIFSDVVQETQEKKQEMWLKPGFKVYDQPLVNGAKEKNTTLAPYTKVTVLRTAKTLRDEFVEIEGQGWVNKAFVTEKDNRMEKVQELLNSKYNSPSYGIYVKQVATGNTAGINPQKEMYSASVTKLPYLYYVQERLNKKVISPTTTYKYIPEVNHFKGSYEPEGSGSLSKTPDGKDYSVQELEDKIAKESDNVGHNILNYYVTHQSDQDFQKTLDKIAKKHWDVEKRDASAEMAGNVMEAVYQQNGSIIEALSSTKFDHQRIARDLPVKVAHKIGDAYDFRHDVAIVYTNSPYVIAIFTDHSDYETISKISKDVYEVLK